MARRAYGSMAYVNSLATRKDMGEVAPLQLRAASVTASTPEGGGSGGETHTLEVRLPSGCATPAEQSTR